jgi:hypothetical protein
VRKTSVYEDDDFSARASMVSNIEVSEKGRIVAIRAGVGTAQEVRALKESDTSVIGLSEDNGNSTLARWTFGL